MEAGGHFHIPKILKGLAYGNQVRYSEDEKNTWGYLLRTVALQYAINSKHEKELRLVK